MLRLSTGQRPDRHGARLTCQYRRKITPAASTVFGFVQVFANSCYPSQIRHTPTTNGDTQAVSRTWKPDTSMKRPGLVSCSDVFVSAVCLVFICLELFVRMPCCSPNMLHQEFSGYERNEQCTASWSQALRAIAKFFCLTRPPFTCSAWICGRRKSTASVSLGQVHARSLDVQFGHRAHANSPGHALQHVCTSK